MKIDSTLLNDFLEKTAVLEQAIFDFQENGVQVAGFDKTNIIGLIALLKKSKFQNYEAIGKIGISDISGFSDIISRFSGNITIQIEQNKYMRISSGTKEFLAILPDISLFNQPQADFSKLQPDFEFLVSCDFLKNAIKDAKLIGASTITFTIKNSTLILSSKTETQEIKSTLALPNSPNSEITASYTLSYLTSILKPLSGQVKIGIKSNYPLIITQEDAQSGISLKYILAPRVEGSEGG